MSGGTRFDPDRRLSEWRCRRRIAEDIGIAVLDLADRARDASRSSMGYLLEMSRWKPAERQWPAESAEG